MQEDRMGPQEYPCNHCDKIFKRKYRLSRHLYKDHIKPTCCICNEAFGRMAELKSHALSDHELKMNKLCSVCKKAFTSKKDLDGHLLDVHNDERPHQCFKCPKRFPNENTLKLHLVNHNRVRALQSFQCLDCSMNFAASYKLEKHRESVHESSKLLLCPECGTEFSADEDMRKLICQLHSENKSPEKPYPCKFCDRAFNNRKKVNIHIRIAHEKDVPFKCETCGYRFETSEQLQAHTGRHSKEKNYKCESCNKSFWVEKALLRHESMMHGKIIHEKKDLDKEVIKEETTAEITLELSELQVVE